MSYRLGEPIDPRRFGDPGEEPSLDAVRALDAAVRGSIQAMLTELRDAAASP
jgi:hypothetical protein